MLTHALNQYSVLPVGVPSIFELMFCGDVLFQILYIVLCVNIVIEGTLFPYLIVV